MSDRGKKEEAFYQASRAAVCAELRRISEQPPSKKATRDAKEATDRLVQAATDLSLAVLAESVFHHD